MPSSNCRLLNRREQRLIKTQRGDAKNEHSTNGDNRKRFSNSSIEFEGKCALCELEEREISDCDSSDDESIVRISSQQKHY